jgi:hypothetical protein
MIKNKKGLSKIHIRKKTLKKETSLISIQKNSRRKFYAQDAPGVWPPTTYYRL